MGTCQCFLIFRIFQNKFDQFRDLFHFCFFETA